MKKSAPDQNSIDLGDFQLVAPLACGGMSDVWRGRDPESGRPVAFKFLNGSDDDSRTRRRRLRNEFQSVASLDHPNIVRIYDFGRVAKETAVEAGGRLRPGQPYFVMEYAGGSIEGLLGEPPTWSRLREILLTLLEALGHAHSRRIVHRDLKPSNVLATGQGDRRRLLLSDFGLAYLRDISNSMAASDPRTRGTPLYMSPEQFRERARHYGPWTDLYGVGCLAWELATGAPPFEAKTPLAIARMHLQDDPPSFRPRLDLPTEFEPWVRRLLAKRPSDRFEHTASAARSLLDIPGEATPTGRRGPDFGRPGLYRSATLEGIPSIERLLEEAPTDNAPPRCLDSNSRATHRPPLTGRRQEQRRLWGQLQATDRDQAPHLVLLEGASGLGKTRLAEWLVNRADELGCATTFQAYHSPVDSRRDGLASMIARHLRLDESTRTPQDALTDWFDDHGPTHAYYWRAIASILNDSGLWPGEMPEVEITMELADQRYAAVVQFLRASASDGPFLLHLDDLHLSRHSVGFARYVIEKVQNFPLLVVGTTRPEDSSADIERREAIDGLADRPRVESVELSPLDASTQRELITALDDFEPDTLDRLVDAGEGNPLVTMQTIEVCLERGLLVRGEPGYALADRNDIDLPESREESAAWQIEQIRAEFDDGAVEALELAAALGREFDADEWETACRMADVDPPAFLEEGLLNRNLLSPCAVGWRFQHPPLREALGKHARSAGRWRRWNAVCADLLSQRFNKTRPAIARRYAYHSLIAQLPDQAIKPLLAALRYAFRSALTSPFRDSLRVLTQLVEAADLPESDRRYVEYTVFRGYENLTDERNHPSAREHLQRARRLASEEGYDDLLSMALRGLGKIHHRNVEFDRALEHFEQASSHLTDAASVIQRGSLLRSLGNSLLRTGRHQEALDHFEEAVDEFEAHPVARAKVIHMIGLTYAREGRFDRATQEILRAFRIFNSQGYLYGAAKSLNKIGDIERTEGHLDQAAEYYRRAVRIAELTAIPSLGHIFISHGQIEVDRGNYQRALGRLDQALDQPKVQGSSLFQFVAALYRSVSLAGLDRWSECAEDLDIVDDFPAETGLNDSDLLPYLERGRELAEAAGRTEIAERYHRQLELRRPSAPAEETSARSTLGETSSESNERLR